MGPGAADVVRVKIGDGKFGGLWEHASQRLLGGESWVYASADEEDEAFLRWGRVYKFKGVEVLRYCVC